MAGVEMNDTQRQALARGGQIGFWDTLGTIQSHPIRVLKTVASCAVLVGGGNGYLNLTGWFRSKIAQSPVDCRGEAVPWITYPCIRFLESRLLPQMTVFEFGAGASTAWWSKRVARVISCEHDRAWFERVQASASANVQMIYAPLQDQQYSSQILQYTKEFDVVVIDGRHRVRCAINSLQGLNQGGVILWDNTDRDHYQQGFDFLKEKGFRRVDFWGMAPLLHIESTTSLFYRDGNCLGL